MTKTGHQAAPAEALCTLDGAERFTMKGAQRILRESHKLFMDILETTGLVGIQFRLVPQRRVHGSPALRGCRMRGPRIEGRTITFALRSGDNSSVWSFRLFVPQQSIVTIDQIHAKLVEYVDSNPEQSRPESTGTVVALFPEAADPSAAAPETPAVEAPPSEPHPVEAPAPIDTRPEYLRLLDDIDAMTLLFWPLVPHTGAEVDFTSLTDAVLAGHTWGEEVVRAFVLAAENRKMLMRVTREVGDLSFMVAGELRERLLSLGVPPKDPRPAIEVPPLPTEAVLQASIPRHAAPAAPRSKFSTPVKNSGGDDFARLVAELRRRSEEFAAANRQLSALATKREDLIGKRARFQASLAHVESELAELETEASVLETKLQDPRLTKAATLQNELLEFMKGELDN